MTAFDTHRPPQPELLEDCVHCGFCLDTCPTYVLWGNEADSPRGRIVLMGEGLTTDGPMSDEMATHFDRCLGCMACVTACPSGVQYDRLIERVRPQVERHHRRSAAERGLRKLLFSTLPYPKRMRALAPLLIAGRKLGTGRLPGRAGTLAKVAPQTTVRELRTKLPERTAAVGEHRGRVALLLGCVQRVFYADVHRATIRTLAAEGFEVLAPQTHDCCGALQMHSGEEEAAISRAQTTIAAFSSLGEVDHVITNAAGCGSAMKEYGELVGTDEARRFSQRVCDVAELLGSMEPRAPRGPIPMRVVYHDSCHLAHAQGVRTQPRELLAAIPGLDLLEVEVEPAVCCGSAGVYNLLQSQAGADLGARKARNLLDTGAEAIAAGNPGCAAQIDCHLRELGRPLPIYHPIELIWRSIAAASADRATAVARNGSGSPASVA
jgi:glycolate oxidase iron-sulfur subunit